MNFTCDHTGLSWGFYREPYGFSSEMLLYIISRLHRMVLEDACLCNFSAPIPIPFLSIFGFLPWALTWPQLRCLAQVWDKGAYKWLLCDISYWHRSRRKLLSTYDILDTLLHTCIYYLMSCLTSYEIEDCNVSHVYWLIFQIPWRMYVGKIQM